MNNLIGKEVLNYRIISLIGRGGMGSVYLAEHKLISKQKVAIKVINANMVNDFTRNMLKDEAEHLAGLHHHNIVTFHDYHIDKEGSIYLIMEYADGKSLDDYIKNVNGLIVEDRICHIFEPILDGVGYAHKHGILHRDIKPANVVITTDGTPKILDFGIAKIIKNNGEDVNDNLVMGTPSYMSPEQVKGEHLDARSDIYSLGVLLHQMLTGNAPYDTTTLTEQDINQKVVEEPLPRMRTFYKYVSDNVQKVVDKATAKNPDERYHSCEEFKKALHRAIYPWKPTLWMKIAAAAVIALIAGSGWYVWDYNRVKTYYYKDYVEVWGVPQGIGELSSGEHSHAHRSYKFTYQKRKLLRVAHVNSLDNLIEDGESERNERPIDQEFTYTENGKVSRVIVKDCSGKVLYVKSYNDKLNTMAFQYDDEHGTERVVSNQTVGYGRLLEQNADDRGHISRWWLEYDENGFVSSIKYAGLDNSPVGDDNGIYGRTFVRDEKGRAKEIHYIGIDGSPQSTKWGLGIKKFYYDEDDNWTKSEYLTTDGKPAYDDNDGVAVYVMEYDKYGNVIYALHEAPDGKLMYPKKHNVAGVHTVYDSKGFNIRDEYLDTDKKPMFVRGQGMAIVEREFDENGYQCKMTFFGPDGQITESLEGNASRTMVNDRHGNVVESWTYSKDGKLCLNTNGYAGFKCEYDSLGNQTQIVYYGKDQKPCETKNGTVGEQYEYDNRQLIKTVTYLGKDLKPSLNHNNVAIMRLEYDKRGNNTRLAFYEPDGKSMCLSSEGTAGWNDYYDDNGNHLERSFFDTKGQSHVPSALHYAKVKYTYDDNGNLKSKKFYNLQGNLTLVDGTAGTEYVCDKRGNVLEDKPIGINGELAFNKLISRYKYDKFDNVTEQSLYNNSGAALNSHNVHRYEYIYNSRNQLVEERHYGKDGNLIILKPSNWAIQKNEYNDRGDIIKRSYYGIDKKPCKIDEGWSSATYEHDPFGNIVKQCFFGVDGKPTDPQEMVPVGIAKYDKWGHMIYVAAQDGKGNFILRPNDKWAISRMEYDNRDNKISESYFDEKDQPTLSSEGYHKCIVKYDKQDRRIEVAYFGTDGKPILVNNYHKETYKYAENSDNVIEQALFGTTGKPVECAGGWHKVVLTYNEEGNLALTKKYYLANGTLRATLQWDGSDWQLVQREFVWQEAARELDSELPHYFGSNNYNLCVQSLRITGNNSCELKFTIPYTTRELSSEILDGLKDVVSKMTKAVEEQLKHRPYVYGHLYDKNGKTIYSVKI